MINIFFCASSRSKSRAPTLHTFVFKGRTICVQCMSSRQMYYYHSSQSSIAQRTRTAIRMGEKRGTFHRSPETCFLVTLPNPISKCKVKRASYIAPSYMPLVVHHSRRVIPLFRDPPKLFFVPCTIALVKTTKDSYVRSKAGDFQKQPAKKEHNFVT